MKRYDVYVYNKEISIHALREEGDPLYSVPGLYKL